ncbi:MAG: YkgJ family cysteine cluster protein [Polyangiaceae bacterium]|nr:YkgJ family cysteine cluster protein [Polyangiaceae bacterium]
MSTSEARANPGSALCLRCGLCCTGEIFENVRLAEDEVEHARSLRLPLLGEPTPHHFGLPCPAHRGGRCSVYTERPRACRSFVCLTLAALEAGDIDNAEADRRVAKLREIADRVRSGLPDEGRSLGLWAAVARFSDEGENADDGDEAWRVRHSAVLLDVLELEHQCRRHFTARGW